MTKTKKITGYALLMYVWENNARDVARSLESIGVKITCQAVRNWGKNKNGIPRKRRQDLVDASGGKIKSVDDLRG